MIKNYEVLKYFRVTFEPIGYLCSNNVVMVFVTELATGKNIIIEENCTLEDVNNVTESLAACGVLLDNFHPLLRMIIAKDDNGLERLRLVGLNDIVATEYNPQILEEEKECFETRGVIETPKHPRSFWMAAQNTINETIKLTGLNDPRAQYNFSASVAKQRIYALEETSRSYEDMKGLFGRWLEINYQVHAPPAVTEIHEQLS